MNKSAARQIHFVGIGSAGLSALARVMLARGWGVSGSACAPSPVLAALTWAGARVSLGHHASFVKGADVVVVASATPADNPEVLAAQARGIPVLTHDRWLAELTRGAQCLAVAGTHGRTTTAALLALMLHEGGLNPTAMIAGEVPQFGGNVLIGRRDFFVIEADEGAFLGLTPTIALVTGVEPDAPDRIEDADAIRTAVGRFLMRVPSEGHIVALGDDPTLRALVRSSGRAPVSFYGFDATNQWQAAALRSNALGGTDFVALKAGRPVAALRLRVPGLASVLHALGATAVADALDVPMASIQTSLASFTGVRRRFEPVGAVGGVEVFDDDAHQPGEVQATLQAARQRFGPRPLWVVFRPHPGALPDDFAAAFAEANRVIVSAVSDAGVPYGGAPALRGTPKREDPAWAPPAGGEGAAQASTSTLRPLRGMPLRDRAVRGSPVGQDVPPRGIPKRDRPVGGAPEGAAQASTSTLRDAPQGTSMGDPQGNPYETISLRPEGRSPATPSRLGVPHGVEDTPRGEPGPPGVSGEELAACLRSSGVPAAHLPTQAEIVHELTTTLPDEAVVITLGGGELSRLGPRVLRALEQRVLEEDR